jgi:branched-chain amino acid transport system substrate-binding protein
MKRAAIVAMAMSAALGAGCGKGGDGGAAGDKPAAAGDKATPPSGATSGTIKIVSSLPRTGSANTPTTAIVNGMKLALDDAGGKAGGFTIRYEDWDASSAKKGNWDPEVEAANGAKAAGDPDVMVYLGTYDSGAAKISMPIVNKANLAMISPANTASGLTKPNMGEPGEPDIYRQSGKITFFRVVPADDIQGRVGAQWMQEMGGKQVYVLDDRSLYGKGIADVFEQTAGDIGMKVLGREGLDPKAQEFRSLMTKIRELKPDWIYVGATTQTGAGQFIKDAVAVGLVAKLMLPDGSFEQPLIDSAGAANANDRAFLTFGGVPPSAMTGKGGELAKRYQQKFGIEPQSYAIYGYVAMQVAIDAIAKAGVKDREAVRAAIAATEQTDGAFGAWKFDANGDTSLTTMSGNVVKDGKFELVKLLEAK